MIWSGILASFALLASGTGTPQEPELPSPQVGQVAPPLGQVYWRQYEGAAKTPPVIAESRGKVIVVQTWVWFCDS